MHSYTEGFLTYVFVLHKTLALGHTTFKKLSQSFKHCVQLPLGKKSEIPTVCIETDTISSEFVMQTCGWCNESLVRGDNPCSTSSIGLYHIVGEGLR